MHAFTPAPTIPAPPIDPTTGLSTEEFTLMLAGKPYLASDPYRCSIADAITQDVYAFNAEKSMAKRREILETFVRNGSDNEKPRRLISLPFFCEYVSQGFEGLECRLIGYDRDSI
jgi:hypothetical protein